MNKLDPSDEQLKRSTEAHNIMDKNYPKPDYNVMFEQLASDFKDDTGYLAPGKDIPMMENNPMKESERFIAWKAWCKGRTRGMNLTDIDKEAR